MRKRNNKFIVKTWILNKQRDIHIYTCWEKCIRKIITRFKDCSRISTLFCIRYIFIRIIISLWIFLILSEGNHKYATNLKIQMTGVTNFDSTCFFLFLRSQKMADRRSIGVENRHHPRYYRRWRNGGRELVPEETVSRRLLPRSTASLARFRLRFNRCIIIFSRGGSVYRVLCAR